MSEVGESLAVLWSEELQAPPLCDVPWFGRSVVLSTGQVHFCCFSEVTVGNVLEKPFEEIWQGSQMQEIRAALARGELPWECASPSCPVYKDKSSGALVSIVQRLPQDVVGNQIAEVQRFREFLTESLLEVEPPVVAAGQEVHVAIKLKTEGYRFNVDRYVAIRYPDGTLRFMPQGGIHPLPYLQNSVVDGEQEVVITLPITDTTPKGAYTIGVALFRPDSSPGFLENCYWAQQKTFVVEGASSLHG